MAGSYKHCVTETGRLRNPEKLNNMLENGGDVYEAIEEMYGMIWWLAHVENASHRDPETLVELARQNYRKGIILSPGVQK